MTEPRKLYPPWEIIEHRESFEVRTANGLTIAFVYFEDENPTRRFEMGRLTKDEARRVAANITHARIGAPGVLGNVRFRSARVPWTDCDIVTSGSTVSVRQLVTDAAQLRICAVKPLRGRSRQAVSLHIPANQTSELGIPRQFFKSRNCDGGQFHCNN